MNTNEVLNKLIAEIERRRDILKPHGGQGFILTEVLKDHYDGLLSFIDSLQQEQPEGGCSEKPNNLLSEWTEEDERTRWNLCSLLTNLRVGKKIEESTFNKYYSWLKIIHIKPRKTRKQEHHECIEKTARISPGLLSNFGTSTYVLDVDLTQDEMAKVAPFGFNSGKIKIKLVCE